VRRLLYLLIWALSAVAPAHALADAYAAQDGHQIGQYTQVIAPSISADLMPGQQAQPPPEQLAISTTWRPWPKWVSGNTARQQLTNILLPIATADYQPGNYTGTLNASAWLNSIGAAPSLAQASGAAQPIILPYSGQKYLANFGVNGNGATTPNAAGSTLTGDMSAVVTVALNSVAPAVANSLSGQWPTTVGIRNWFFYVGAGNGKLQFDYSTDGTNGVTLTSSATLASVGLAAGQLIYLGVFQDVDNGASGNDVKFYWSTDKVTWTQLGLTQTTAGAITRHTSTGNLNAWAYKDTLLLALNGKGYRSELYSGNYFAGTGTRVADYIASDWPETTTNGATAVSSTTGETWTLNNTGTLLAQIVGSPQLLFDGAAMYMRMATTLVQPTTVILIGKQITWAGNDGLFDGVTLFGGALYQAVATPKIRMNAGSGVADNTNLAVNTLGIVTVAFNGASSYIQVNNNAQTTGSAGTNSMGGLTLGALGDLSGDFANIQVKEIIILPAIPSAAKLAKIISLLDQIYGVYVQNTDASDWLPSWTAVAANDEEYRLMANGRPRGVCCGR